MARIKLGVILNDIRGSIGEFTYSIWKAGVHVLRSKAAVIANPMSTDQAAIRCNLANLSKLWYDTLTPEQRAAWSAFALTKPGMGDRDGGIYTVIKGNNGIMSGMNAYIMVNQWLKSIDQATVNDAPVGLTPPTPPLNVEATWLSPDLTVTWDIPQTAKMNARGRIWMACHQPNMHRQLVAVELTATTTKVITTVKAAQGKDTALADLPGNYVLQMDTVDLDGTKSGPSEAIDVTIT